MKYEDILKEQTKVMNELHNCVIEANSSGGAVIFFEYAAHCCHFSLKVVKSAKDYMKVKYSADCVKYGVLGNSREDDSEISEYDKPTTAKVNRINVVLREMKEAYKNAGIPTFTLITKACIDLIDQEVWLDKTEEVTVKTICGKNKIKVKPKVGRQFSVETDRLWLKD